MNAGKQKQKLLLSPTLSHIQDLGPDDVVST